MLLSLSLVVRVALMDLTKVAPGSGGFVGDFWGIRHPLAMPKEQPRPPLTPIAEQLRTRAVSKREMGGTLKLGRLLKLDAVVKQADSDDRYRLALAFEALLVEVVDCLDATFFVAREKYKSPTWIARGIFRLDPGWPEDIASRRGQIVQKYGGGNADHFRQTYEKDLYEHIARQLEGWQVAEGQQATQPLANDPSDDSAEWPWDRWMQTLFTPLLRLYDDLERGLHDPVPSNGVPTVATSVLVEDWAAFLTKFEAGISSEWGVISGRDLKRHTRMGDIATFLPLAEVDRLVIVSEFSKRKARRTPFENYLRSAGRDLHAEWIRFLSCCDCGCAGHNNPKRYQYECVVHKLLYFCEWSLDEYHGNFIPYWETRLPDDEQHPDKYPDWVSRDPLWSKKAEAFGWPKRGIERFIYPADLGIDNSTPGVCDGGW